METTKYSVLASHYDALVKDDEAFNQYIQFITTHSKAKKIYEMACGSGEISLRLSQSGSAVVASDLSNEMLSVATAKDTQKQIVFKKADMRNLHETSSYDTVLCLCDSINYVKEAELTTIFESVYQMLEVDGTFIFDMHSVDRLYEFEEPFYEAGIVNGVEYIWTIEVHDTELFHTFVFYEDAQKPVYEHHIQSVFSPQRVCKLLETIGFLVTIYTDFDQLGIHEGEKYFYICKKK